MLLRPREGNPFRGFFDALLPGKGVVGSNHQQGRGWGLVIIYYLGITTAIIQTGTYQGVDRVPIETSPVVPRL